MTGLSQHTQPVTTTSARIVIPFYVYAAVSFLTATILLLFSVPAFAQHYFHPHTLAITHLMALGWGTMIILGAGYQLVPVFIESELYSNKLAYASFALAALGIPLLVYAFYTFHMGVPAQLGAGLINASITCFLVNLVASFVRSGNENVHTIFVLTAVLWLMVTTIVGFLLVYNFSRNILSADSLHYLSVHAHMGIVGWFLLLVIGVGSKLIPMFLISKYTNAKLLWWMYFLINAGLIVFILLFLQFPRPIAYLVPVTTILMALLLFVYYCCRAYRERIRKDVDGPVKISLLSASITILPVCMLLIIIPGLAMAEKNGRLVIAYGFAVFFGWMTAIILGMTFKTLPFIVWNKVYHREAGREKTPNPKSLFSESLFAVMAIAYLTGFVLFIIGALCVCVVLMKIAAVFLLVAATGYNLNVGKILMHKPRRV